MQSDITYTIEQFITSDKDLISYQSLSLLDKNENDDVFISYNILNEYLEFLKEISVSVQLSDMEYIKYSYKPKLLSYDIYGTTELFFILLAINNICDIKEFNFREIKMIPPKKLNEMLSMIFNKENITLLNNKSEIFG